MTASVQPQKEAETGVNGPFANVKGKWAGRWIWAAVIQGAIVTIITVLMIQPLSYFNITPYFNPAMVIAGGGGGTWMFTGYIIYLVVGVVGVAVTAIFYFYLEGVQGKVYHGLSNYIAWGHYVLMNVGVASSMILMIFGRPRLHKLPDPRDLPQPLRGPHRRVGPRGLHRNTPWRHGLHPQKQDEVRAA